LGGVGGGLCPPPFIVISNEVRNLLILERGFHPLSNFSPKAKIILIPSHFERSEKSPPFNRRQTYYFVILTSVVCEEESPQLILFGWSSRRVSAPPRYNEETPHCVRGDKGERRRPLVASLLGVTALGSCRAKRGMTLKKLSGTKQDFSSVYVSVMQNRTTWVS
jgi:hypothetical protein